ncbi:putative HAF family extracellular repeat protein [Herbihabitans rhizosphaerae]|uniref:Putative HAF family extracellular repeat protein n=1 Tax=Herbihabitans rhizosphaerae TaxID=1872711 RepID=A0A4Q7KX86_9PSEU|nr:hypothetical protein [Herbihabitans rhizosphaerae]RZS41246.1 putative HAF family extracellular repeat protein [Herbihabitans rhizosphaerae]
MALVVAVGLAALLTPATAFGSQLRISATQLPTLPGTTFGRALAINEHGQIAGFSGVAYEGTLHAVTWRDGQPTDLGPDRVASLVNELGQVAGTLVTAPYGQHGLLWRDGAEIDLLPGAVGSVIPTALNNRGEILVSFTRLAGWETDRFGIWRDGALRELALPDGAAPAPNVFAKAMNDRGEVAGAFLSQQAGPNFPFRCADACVRLPSPGGDDSYLEVVAINGRGQVVGSVQSTPGGKEAVRWTGGRMELLRGLGGGVSRVAPSKQAINFAGHVVGLSQTAAGVNHAVLWRAGRTIDLGTLPGHDRSAAVAINDVGDVVGTSTTTDGRTHGFLWRKGRLHDLGAGTEPAALNNAGQIVGWRSLPGGPAPVRRTVS